MVGDPNYDKGVEVKKTFYSKNNMDVISVYPRMFAENWKYYIMNELEISMKSRYKILKLKPYWSKEKSIYY